ncbi:MAG: Ig-like domain-containing protein [Burkholderiales bacterium]
MNKPSRLFIATILCAGALALAGCAEDNSTSGAGSTVFGGSTPPQTGTAGPTGTRVQLLVSSPQIPSAGASTVDLSAIVLDANGQAIAGETVAFSTGTDPSAFINNISGAGVADANGLVTAKLNVGASKTNRTVTVSATAAGASNQVPVQVVGSTVEMNASGNTLPDTGASPVTLTITAKDSAGTPVAGTAVTLTRTGTGNMSFSPAATGTTNASGQFVVTAAGTAGGTATVTASALGATVATIFTVTSTGANFAIDQTTNLTSGVVTLNPTLVTMRIGDSLVVRVNAPAPAVNVQFVTTMGSWNGGGTSALVAVAGGIASATLTTAQAGSASVQVFDQALPTSNDSLTVSITAAVAASITLQASPSVVPTSIGSTTGVSTLVATVSDAAGQPVGDVPVAFSIINPTGGGESLSPAVSFSASTAGGGLGLGQARTTFTSGSLPSAAGGVQIRASVLGTAVATEAIGVNATPSGNDAGVVIGGTAGSVAFGQATVLAEANNATNYVLAMSVLVADVNGSPAPAGTVVNLSAWPIAWSTGGGCLVDADTATTGTFLNEDRNENLILDTTPVEDGTRDYYAGGTAGAGTADQIATPSNSAGGLVPGTVTTDANGVATFNLTYGKSSALWIVTRIRGRTVVQGTEAVSEVQFRLPALEGDVNPCRLPDSPYFF